MGCATQPRRVACASAPSTRGWPTSSPAAPSRTDSNASRTMLFDIEALRWGDELCDALGVPPATLPEAAPSASVLGETDPDAFLGARVPRRRHGGRPAGGAVRPGLPRPGPRQEHVRDRQLRAAERRAAPSAGAARTAEHDRLGNRRPRRLRARGKRVRHRRRGPVAARRARGSSTRPPRPRRMAESLDSNDGVYFVPALTGLGSPHWDPYARGTIVGLTRGTRPRAPRARGARGDRLPDRRRGGGDGGRVRRSRSANCGLTAARSATAG